MQRRRKNLQHYAQAIELHQKYGYGSRKISYIIPVLDRTIRRWFTKFAQENAQQSDFSAIKRKHAAEGRVSEISSTPAGETEGRSPEGAPAGVVPVQSNRKE